MFSRDVKHIDELLNRVLRLEGLEMPLLQKRLIDSWEQVVGKNVASCSEKLFIRNQTLFVKIQSPALRQDLSMMKTELVRMLNEEVNSMVIADIKFY